MSSDPRSRLDVKRPWYSAGTEEKVCNKRGTVNPGTASSMAKTAITAKAAAHKVEPRILWVCRNSCSTADSSPSVLTSEIGRASCRERGCQHGLVSGVAVTL